MKKEIKLLVLEDVEEDFQLIERTLRKAGVRFQSRLVDTKSEYLDAIVSYKPDLILSDHSLPQFNSTEAFALLKDTGIKTPFIIVTGNVSEEFAVNSIKQGVDDYVLKSNLERLPSAIDSALKKREDEVQREIELQKLEENNQELTRYNKDLESFVNNVSSNLRNPLSSMLDVINLIKQSEKDDDELKAYYEMMEMSIQKLDDALADLKVQSQEVNGDLDMEVVEMDKLIEDQIQQMQYMSGAENIHKEVSVNADVSFYSNAYHLSVIIHNLISNSIKYHDNEKDNPFIKIKVDVTSDRALLEFSDNGIGIDAKSLTKIFDMHFRATDKSDGSGLGLHLVKTSVDKLQGSIDVKSRLHFGTRFKIQLPNFSPERSPSQNKFDATLKVKENKAATA